MAHVLWNLLNYNLLGPSIDLCIGPSPHLLCNEVAFRIVPIAHQYNMRAILKFSEAAFETAGKAAPLALWPSVPIASSQVPKHPGLIQWLALADSKQCAPLVETCLSQLLCQESDKAIHEATASPHLRQLIVGLRPETKNSIIFKMAGLPLGFQVNECMMPFDITCYTCRTHIFYMEVVMHV